MKRIIFTVALAFLMLSMNAFSTLRVVPLDYSTIQAGINAASDGDTVLVFNKATYTENIDFKGKEIVLASRYISTNDSTYITGTILDGDDNGPVIFVDSKTDTNARVIGFTIQNGNGNSDNDGGGIYIDDADLVVENCIIKDNDVTGNGGGIFATNFATMIIRDSKILSNSSSNGCGGWFEATSILKMFDCVVDNNRTSSNGHGGGIYLVNSTSSFYNSTFKNNDAAGGYG